MGGLRYDNGKNRLDLLPPEWVWGLGVITTEGAKKYAERNWEKGMPWSKVWGPMLRHAFKWLMGERYDAETGCHHLLMVAWNALALFTYDLRQIGENDLQARGLAPTPVSIISHCRSVPLPEQSSTGHGQFPDSQRAPREGVE